MPQSFPQSFLKVLNPKSHPKKSSVNDGRICLSSNNSTLLNVKFPASIPEKQPKNDPITEAEDDMLDPEDQAWGSPPPSNWSLPKFPLRRSPQKS